MNLFHHNVTGRNGSAPFTKFYGLLTGLAVFIVYMFTLAPSVIQIDTGELAAVQALLGIAHPTGYPLFTMLGYLWTLLPISTSTIYELNILAAVWCSGGIVFFVYTVKNILTNISLFIPEQKEIVKVSKKNKLKSSKSPKDKTPPIAATVIKVDEVEKFVKSQSDGFAPYFAAIASGLILAFSKTFWVQSTSVEVYSLHIFFIGLILLVLVTAFIKSKSEGKHSFWYLAAVALSFGFANHMTTLLILPAIAYLYFLTFGFNKASYIRILKMLLIFFPLLILFYSYLPIRAAANPALNWGNPIDMERILRHISGKQYQVWLFSSFDSAKKQLEYFFTNIINEFSINLLLAVVGMIVSYISARRFFFFSIILFISTVAYSINYDINDIDSYFILAYFALSLFAVFGIIKVFMWLHHHKLNNKLAGIVIIAFIGVHTFLTFEEVDQSRIYVFEDYTKEVLASVDKNSIVFSYQWDYFISASYYFQFVEDYRKDIIVIDKELLRRSWYYNQLETNYPGIISSLQPTVNQFLKALQPFERSENFDAQILETLFQKIMKDLVSVNYDAKSFYIAPELFEQEMQKGQFTLPEGFILVPDIFFFKVQKGNKYLPAKDPEFTIRFPKKLNHYHKTIENIVGSMLIRRAMYEMQFDKVERAQVYIKKLKNDFPDFPIPRGIADVIER